MSPVQEETTLKRIIVSTAFVAVIAAGLGSHAMGQGAPQTVAIMEADPQTVATGFRASKIVGSSVVNEENETVGSVDDLIVTPNEKAPYAVLSVGGFLGAGHEMSWSRSARCTCRTRKSCCRVPPRMR